MKEKVEPWTKERYDEVCSKALVLGYKVITKYRKGIKFLSIGKVKYDVKNYKEENERLETI
jgi:hypothetical protein